MADTDMANCLQLARTIVTGLLLTAGPIWAEGTVSELLNTLPPGKRIEVVMRNGEKVIGNRGALGPAGFVLEPDSKGAARRELTYAEVATVRPKMTRKGKIGIGVGIYLVLAVIGLVLGG